MSAAAGGVGGNGKESTSLRFKSSSPPNSVGCKKKAAEGGGGGSGGNKKLKHGSNPTAPIPVQPTQHAGGGGGKQKMPVPVKSAATRFPFVTPRISADIAAEEFFLGLFRNYLFSRDLIRFLRKAKLTSWDLLKDVQPADFQALREKLLFKISDDDKEVFVRYRGNRMRREKPKSNSVGGSSSNSGGGSSSNSGGGSSSNSGGGCSSNSVGGSSSNSGGGSSSNLPLQPAKPAVAAAPVVAAAPAVAAATAAVLHIAGAPAAVLPIAGAPAAVLPIAGAPLASLAIAGAPAAVLPAPGMCVTHGCVRISYDGEPSSKCCQTCTAGSSNHGPKCCETHNWFTTRAK